MPTENQQDVKPRHEHRPDFDYEKFVKETKNRLAQYPDGHIEKVKYLELLEELKKKTKKDLIFIGE